MNRGELIEHFKGLADMMGMALKLEPTNRGLRLICNGHSVVLPHRRNKIRRIGLLENKLGLRL